MSTLVIDGKPRRARVLERRGERVDLGVYVEGSWMRIEASSTLALEVGSWIEGILSWDAESELLRFRITNVPARASRAQSEPPARESGDTETGTHFDWSA